MKLVAEHLGEIILAVAGVALVVGVVLTFGDTINDFFADIIAKYSELATGDTSPLWNTEYTPGT